VKKCSVYGLRHRDLTDYFYVGSTKHDPLTRLKAHIHHSRSAHPFNRHLVSTIKNLGAGNIVVDVLEETDENGRFLRENWWIAKLSADGVRLTNLKQAGWVPDRAPSLYSLEDFTRLVERNRDFYNHVLAHLANTCDLPTQSLHVIWKPLTIERKVEFLQQLKDCNKARALISQLVERAEVVAA
jgi:hypothetical protein